MQDARLLWAYRAALLLHGRFVGYLIFIVSMFILILNVIDVTLNIGWGYSAESIIVGVGASLAGVLIIAGEKILSRKMNNAMTSLKAQAYSGIASLRLRSLRAFAFAFAQIALPGTMLSVVAAFLKLHNKSVDSQEVVASHANMACVFVIAGLIWASVVLILFLRNK